MGKKNNSYSNKQTNNDKKFTISFEYYDTAGKYCISDWDKTEIVKGLNSLKDINSKTYGQLLGEKFTYHFHEVDWSETTERKGFQNPTIAQLPAFQLALKSVGQKAR